MRFITCVPVYRREAGIVIARVCVCVSVCLKSVYSDNSTSSCVAIDTSPTQLNSTLSCVAINTPLLTNAVMDVDQTR